MYDSELFKTVWTRIGQMCSYITCAKSYLTGQFDDNESYCCPVNSIIVIIIIIFCTVNVG